MKTTHIIPYKPGKTVTIRGKQHQTILLRGTRLTQEYPLDDPTWHTAIVYTELADTLILIEDKLHQCYRHFDQNNQPAYLLAPYKPDRFYTEEEVIRLIKYHIQKHI